MRYDMAQVVTERPRSGPRFKTPKGYLRSMQRLKEDLPLREGMCKKWIIHGCDKAFTDVLGPIYGYLRSKVGQQWNAVYSEICRCLPNNSLNTSHVREHIENMVETNVILINGVPCYGEGRLVYGSLIESGFRAPQYYVHPVTGILCAGKTHHTKFKKPRGIGVLVPGDELKQYHRLNGVWYVLTLIEAVDREKFIYCHFFDMAYKRFFYSHELLRIYGGKYYAVEKKQLNSKEIKVAGLRRK